MAEETLLTAARRAARFFNIDMQKGGFITEQTEYAFHILEREIEREIKKEKADATTKTQLSGSPSEHA